MSMTTGRTGPRRSWSGERPSHSNIRAERQFSKRSIRGSQLQSDDVGSSRHRRLYVGMRSKNPVLTWRRGEHMFLRDGLDRSLARRPSHTIGKTDQYRRSEHVDNRRWFGDCLPQAATCSSYILAIRVDCRRAPLPKASKRHENEFGPACDRKAK